MPDWIADYSAKDVGQIDSDVESLEDEYTKPPGLPLATDLLMGDTEDKSDEYDTNEIISQLSGDVDDSEELRANVQNLIGDKVRNSVLTLHRNVEYLEPNISSGN